MTRVQAALAALAVAAAAGLAGCGGGRAKPSGVASLAGTNRGGATTTTVSKLTVTQLYDVWAQCMRQHGVSMADPVLDSQGQVSINASNTSQATFEAANKACDAQHKAARNATQGGQVPDKPDPARMLNFSKCMRAHGLADFPDPSPNGGLQISSSAGSDLNPSNPTFQKAQQACQPIMGSLKGGEKVMTGSPNGGGGKGG